MVEAIKTVVITVFSAILAYLEPVYNAITLLFIMSGIDILFGIIGAIIVDGERFRFRKFIMAAVFLLIYLGVITLIYTVGKLQGDFAEAMVVVKTITYVFIYFYSANVLKNLAKLFPTNRIICFLDYILNMEFVKKIPYLNDFLTKERGKDENSKIF